jgi:outer membrane protein
MKKILSWVILATVLVSGSVLAEFKVGYVETQRLFKESPAALKAQERLKKEFSGREQEILASDKKVVAQREAFQRDSVTMSESVRRDKERALNEMILDQQRKIRQFREDLDIRQRDENQALVEKASKLVQEYGKKEGYDLILNEYGPVGYISPKIDITDKIIKVFTDGK